MHVFRVSFSWGEQKRATYPICDVMYALEHKLGNESTLNDMGIQDLSPSHTHLPSCVCDLDYRQRATLIIPSVQRFSIPHLYWRDIPKRIPLRTTQTSLHSNLCHLKKLTHGPKVALRHILILNQVNQYEGPCPLLLNC